MHNFLYYFLLFSFIGGQILALAFGNIRVLLLDVAVFLFVFISTLKDKNNLKTLHEIISLLSPFIAISLIGLLIQFGRLTYHEVLISSFYLVRFVMYMSIIATIRSLKTFKILFTLWGSGVLLALLGLVQYVFYPNLRNLQYLGWDPHHYRIFSTLLDPNFAGIIFVLTIILGFYLFAHKINNNFLVIGQIVVLVSFVLTFSRGSFIAFSATTLLYLIYTRKYREIVIVTSLFGLLLLLVPKPGGEGVNLFRTKSVVARIESMKEGVELWMKSPIVGHGYNSLAYIRSDLKENEFTDELPHSRSGIQNSYVTILATTGVLGFTSLIYFVLGVFKRLRTDNKSKLLIINSLLAVSIHALFDNTFFYPTVLVWMGVLVGNFYLMTDS